MKIHLGFLLRNLAGSQLSYENEDLGQQNIFFKFWQENTSTKWGTWSPEMWKVLPTIKRKRLRPELGSSCFRGPAKMHSEFCFNPLNLYLVSWWLNFICSAKNFAIEELGHLYWSNSMVTQETLGQGGDWGSSSFTVLQFQHFQY